MTKRSYAEEVAQGIIEGLKNGTAPWIKPWEPGDGYLPQNPVTQKAYRGMNALHLMATANAKGFSDPRWLTYKQAAALGAQVKKGESSTLIQYWQWQEVRNAEGAVVLDANTGQPQKKLVSLESPRVFLAHVFNADQIDGLPPLEHQHAKVKPEFEVAEALLNAGNPTINYTKNDRCFYNAQTDVIALVEREQFNDLTGFYQTALHEKAHWSGHGERLNRDLAHPFGSEGYAKEELRAEICSMLIGQSLGIGHDPGTHLSYIQSWIQVLEDDPKEIFRATRDAEKMKSYLFELANIHETTLETSISSESLGQEHIIPKEVVVNDEVAASLTLLHVPYTEKDEAKAFGAKWLLSKKSWCVEAGTALSPFKRWMEPMVNEANIQDTLSQVDKKTIEQSVIDEKQKRLEEEKRLQQETAEEAKVLLEAARQEAVVYRHPFFNNMNIPPEMVPPLFVDKDNNGLLSVADNQGNIKGLQKLSPEGQTFLQPHTEIEGCYHAVNHLKGKVEPKLEDFPIIIAKNYTTALILHHELGVPVAVALTEDNLLPVAKAIKEGLPEATIYVVSEKTSPHQQISFEKKVIHAAKAVDGIPIMPSFLKGEDGRNWQDALEQSQKVFHAKIKMSITLSKRVLKASELKQNQTQEMGQAMSSQALNL